MLIRQFPLSQVQLRELLDYDPITGIFRWRKPATSHSRVKPGAPAGHRGKDSGYVLLSIAGAYWKAHRVAWFWVHGVWPPELVDHKNQNTSDNRIENLRLASISENRQNMNRYRSNTSGHKGVYWHKSNSKWAAQISHNGKRTFLGAFEQVEDAAAAYAKAAARLHQFNPSAAQAA